MGLHFLALAFDFKLTKKISTNMYIKLQTYFMFNKIIKKVFLYLPTLLKLKRPK